MDIHDSRTVVDFQKFTFSGHLRTHVYKVLNENTKLGHADYACFWSLELMCSGIVHSLWNTLFEAAALHINRAAPNVFLYLVNKYEKFSLIEGHYSVMSMTDIRNNHDARNIVCEVTSALALCRKNKLPPLPKIKPEHDFQQITITENLKSPSANYGRHLAKEEDPLELYIPFNEFVYCLRPETRDETRGLYWASWIIKYAKVYKKQNKQPLVCAFRNNPYIEDKFGRDVIWVLWEAILEASRQSPQAGVLAPYMDALFKLHCLRWNPSVSKNKLVFLITAIQMVCESNTLDIHYAVPHNILQIQSIIENIPQWINAIIQTKRTFS